MHRWVITLSLLLIGFTAQASDIKPFEATYELKAGGWPTALVHHSLTAQDGVWTSTMKASVKIATGREYGRFRVADDHLQAIDFYSRYRLFGFGDDYRMNAQTLAELPDRQTALVMMGRHVDQATCKGRNQPPCEFVYLDHKQKPHTMDYRVIGQQAIDVPAGHWQTFHVELWDEDKPKRLFHFYLAPQYPGLLVQVDYFKHGELDSRMQMTQFTPGTGG